MGTHGNNEKLLIAMAPRVRGFSSLRALITSFMIDSRIDLIFPPKTYLFWSLKLGTWRLRLLETFQPCYQGMIICMQLLTSSEPGHLYTKAFSLHLCEQ